MWTAADMRIALAGHDVATVFRLIQRYGFSQRAIAALTGITQAEVSEIVCGPRRVGAYVVLDRLVDGLALPRGWVGLAFDDETADLRGLTANDGDAMGVLDMSDLSCPTARYSKETKEAHRRTRRLLST